MTEVEALLRGLQCEFVQFINDVGAIVLIHLMVPPRGLLQLLLYIILKPNVGGKIRNAGISYGLIYQLSIHLGGREY